MIKGPTPHVGATNDKIAKTVLMPGDPLRSKFIAENFLRDVFLFNNIRGIQGYTGTYKNTKVSVMASGMGMPSMGVYSYELFNFLDVDNIIRIGSAGTIQNNINLRDLVIGMGTCTDSRYAEQYHLQGTYAPIANYNLLSLAVEEAKKLGVPHHVGNLLSSDHFYNDREQDTIDWAKMGVLAIEMEAAALYMNAARAGKNALAICTVSDHITKNQKLSVLDRQESFTQMMQVALEVATGLR